MNAALEGQEKTFSLNTRLFENCLDGVDDETAQRRPNEHTNHLAFLACHVVDARFYLARLMGSKEESPFTELENVNRVEEMQVVPPLAEVRGAWSRATAALSSGLEAVTPAQLSEEAQQQFPIDDDTLLGVILFLLQHESFHIGQMALLRKFLGLGAMRYD
jgi:hypothetical protein